MNYSRVLSVAASTLGLAIAAFAQTSASGVLSYTGSGGGLNHYSILLSNTGSTGIETFWFGWIPGEDYMATKPVDFTEAAGWNAPVVTGQGNGSDGYAIRWESSAGLGAGDSATFTFESASTLAQLAGDSIYYAHPQVSTSFVYSGIFPGGTSDKFVVQTVPTPPSAVALGIGILGLAIRRKTRRSA